MTQATPIAANFRGADMRGIMIDNSPLQGAGLGFADLSGGVIIGTSAWRINGAPKPSPAATIGLESNRPPFKSFADWRKEQLDRVADPKARVAVDKALAVLDPDRKVEEEEEFAKWLTARAELPLDREVQSKLTQEFIELACDANRGSFVAYNLIYSAAPRAMGEGFRTFAEKVARANDAASTEGAAACPGAVGLAKDALQQMAEILKRGTKPQ
jgi:hypothetical protein